MIAAAVADSGRVGPAAAVVQRRGVRGTGGLRCLTRPRASGRLCRFANSLSRRHKVDFQRCGDQESRLMLILVLFLVRFVGLLFSGDAAVAMENAALRLQPACEWHDGASVTASRRPMWSFSLRWDNN